MLQRFRGLIVLLALLATLPYGPARAADEKQEAAEPVYDLGKGIDPPRLVHHVEPEYTPGSRGVRVEGIVAVGLVVTSAGMPKDLRVVQSLDKDIDATVVDAVKQWRFDPARKEGKSVAVRITVEVRFHQM